MITAFLTCLAIGNGGTGLCAKWQVQEVVGNVAMCELVRSDFIRRREGFMVSSCYPK